jgi:pimeloyl-ACP methyl ester carboxylesterase
MAPAARSLAVARLDAEFGQVLRIRCLTVKGNSGQGSPSGRRLLIPQFKVAYFASNSAYISYEDHDDGSPVVLIYGFGVDARRQWGETGLIKFLAPHFRVIALDCRGHGRSERFYDPDAYAMRNMSGDVLNLLDYLQIDRALLVGFSLGSRVCFEIMTTNPKRCRAAVLSGWGPDNSTSDAGRREELATALLAADAASITEYQRRIRRAVLEAGNDLSALAACIRCDTNIPQLSAVTPISVPVLFVKGVKDYVAGDPNGLSGYFRESRALVIDNNGHASVVADPRFHTAVADFLAAAPA